MPRRSIPPAELPFVGRESELAELRDAVESKRPVAIIGVAGSGKSRLVGELRSGEGEIVVIGGKATQETRLAPYGPIIEITAQAQRLLDGALPAIDTSTIEPARTEQAQQLDVQRHRQWLTWWGALESLQANLARQMVMVVEDIQWADADSLALIGWAAQRPSSVAIVLTSRNVPSGRLGGLATIPLAPLSTVAIAQLLNTLGDPTPAQTVHESTRGLPLQVREWITGRHAEVQVGQTLDPTAGLSEALRSMLSVCALVDGPVDPGLVGHVLEVEALDVLDLMDGAVTAGVVGHTPGGGLEISHDRYREQSASWLSLRRRAELHRRILAVLESRHGDDPRYADRLAHHATEAAIDGNRRPAITHLVRAGMHARHRLAPEAAAGHLATAVKLAELDGDVIGAAEARIELALALVATADPAAEDVLLRVFEEADFLEDGELYARAALALPAGVGAVGLSFQGDAAAAFRLREASRRIPIDHPLRAEVEAQLAFQQHATLSSEGWADHVRRCHEIAEASGRMEDELSAFLLEHSVRRPEGGLERALHEYPIWIERLNPRDPWFMPAAEVGVVSAMRNGDLAEADRLLTLITTSIDPIDPATEWTVTRTKAALAHARGEIEAFEQLAVQSITAAHGTRHAEAAGVYFGFQAATLLRERRLVVEAGPAVDEWCAQHPSYLAFRAARAWQRSDLGAVEEARVELTHFFAQDLSGYAERVEGLLGLAMAASAAWKIGDRASCERVYGLLEPFAEEWIIIGNGTVVDGPTRRVMALVSSALGHHERALEEITSATDACVRAGATHLETTCLRDRAFVHRAAREHGQAVEWFEIAADRYAAVGLDDHATFLRAEASEVRTMQPVAPETAPAPPTPPTPRTAVETTEPSGSAAGAELRLDGVGWRIGFETEAGSLPNLKGLQMIALLVGSPGRSFSAAELSHLVEHGAIAPSANEATDLASSDQAALDDEALEAYRTRLGQIATELERADRRGDAAASDRLVAEAEAIEQQLRGDTGLSGRSRKISDEDERARVRVTKSIRSSMRRIEEVSPGLADHLRRTLSTGIRCAYEPDPRAPVTWRL